MLNNQRVPVESERKWIKFIKLNESDGKSWKMMENDVVKENGRPMKIV